MATILIDGGYFVGRFENHWNRHTKKKNMRYWWEQGKQRNITKEELFGHLNRIFSYDMTYLHMKISEMNFPRRVIVCYDGIYGRRPRGSAYPDYKKNRRGGVSANEHKGIDVRERIVKCGYDPHALDDYWSYEYDDYMEADDLIAELCSAFPRNEDIVVMTKDRDLYQLLEHPNVRIHNFTKFITVEDFESEYGIEPKQFLDLKSLAGDKSDNIPGIKGVGPKTAAKWLRKYGCIEDIPLDLIDEESKESLKLWKRICSIPYHSA